jgi:succinate dehydrogenase (ubiquinone) cytochrome b560 subunit
LAVILAFYAFMIGYIGLPLVGLPFDSNALVAAFGALPIIPKIAIKFLAAIPFTFHSFNGIRHMIWDTAHELTLKGVYRTGYTVLGLTLVSSLVLAVI